MLHEARWLGIVTPALMLTLAAAACGGSIYGETAPASTQVTGTDKGTPEDPPPAPPADASPAPVPPADASTADASPGPPPHHAPVAPPTAIPGAPTNGTSAFPWATSCNVSPPPASPARPAPAASDRAAFLEEVSGDVVGHWYGQATTPWNAPYGVFLSLEADGHYATRSLDVSEAAFYYGTDLDTDLKRWSLKDLTVLGAASGTIDIAFNYASPGSPPSFGLPSWTGLLHDVTLDTAGNRLKLSFSTSTGLGPIVFDVWRCAE